MQFQQPARGLGALGLAPRPAGSDNRRAAERPALRARDAHTRAPALLAALAVCAVALGAAAPAALAHAQLLGTSPQSGSTVAVQPAEVIFEFNQNVGGTLGAVRVYDAQGQEVDNLNVSHPDGNEHWMGVGLKPHLPDGTYTATYRVISADTHIVYGGAGLQHRPCRGGADGSLSPA